MAYGWLIAAAVAAVGQIQAGQAKKQQAQRLQQAKEFEAQQLEQQATAEVAAGQRRGFEEERQSRLLQSRALALAAASGAGASDPTVVNLIADLAGEGAYRKAVQLYEGENRARLARMGAAGSRFEGASALEFGKAQERASEMEAVGTIFSAYAGASGGSGMSLFGKYGKTSGSLTTTRGSFQDTGTPGLYPYG